MAYANLKWHVENEQIQATFRAYTNADACHYFLVIEAIHIVQGPRVLIEKQQQVTAKTDSFALWATLCAVSSGQLPS